jgi:hypothetical protein
MNVRDIFCLQAPPPPSPPEPANPFSLQVQTLLTHNCAIRALYDEQGTIIQLCRPETMFLVSPASPPSTRSLDYSARALDLREL